VTLVNPKLKCPSPLRVIYTHIIELYSFAATSSIIKMPLTEDTNPCRYRIRAYHPGEITINDEVFTRSIILTPESLIRDWGPQSLADLTAEYLEKILELKPEIILLGTGKKFIMPQAALLAPIYERKLNVECMDTGAACRTFIALSSEARNVAAALLIE